jgi:hypothetical protein
MKQIYFGVATTLLLLIQYSTAFSQNTDRYHPAEISSRFFIENKGQIRDQFNNPMNQIDFVLHGSGLNVFIGAGRIYYQFARPEKNSISEWQQKTDLENKFKFPKPAAAAKNQRYDLYRLEMELSGADLNTTPRMEEPAGATFNYYLPGCGANGIKDVAAYRRIVYPNIYPGTDWVIYLKDGKLKYDFILHEGAVASNIIIQYKGAQNQILKPDGSLTVTTPLGQITEEAPVAWTEKDHTPVRINFTPGNTGWGFAIAPWKGSLVLDPGLSWSTYYGGNGMEVTEDVHTHNVNVYITGCTTSLNQIATSGTYQTTYYGGVEGDAFLASFGSNGSLLWATYYGGNANDLGYSIATDPSGDIYLAGYTESGTGIATPGAHQTDYGAGFNDAFLAKFNSLGQRIWSTYYGGSGPDYGHSVVVDGGYVYLCGLTYSTTAIATPGSYQSTLTTSGGNTGNGFLAKWDFNGNLQWGTYFGAGTTTASSVTAGQDHGIYITGATDANIALSTTGSHQSALAGLNDNFLAKFNAAGQRQWATYFGGTANESTFPVVMAGEDDHIYIAGITYSFNQISTAGTSRPVYSNGVDGYLASFTPAGVQEWGTYVGPGNTSNGITVSDISMGNCGTVYVVGDVYPSVGLNTSQDALRQVAGGGTYDGALVRYDASGKSNYCSYIGGTAQDNITGVALSDDGNLYVLGMTESTSDIATDGAYQSIYAGTRDAFLMKFQDILFGNKESPDVVFDSVQCINDTFQVFYTVTAPFATGNTFTAELSDNNGSFLNAITIGQNASATSGVINCAVPQTVAPGGGYRIRISASAPADKSVCTLPLWLNLPPIPEVTVHGDTLISSVAINYQWYKNGQVISGATSQSFLTHGISGWYQVKVTDPVTGCTSHSDSIAIGNVGIGELADIRGDIKVYPNPFGGQVYVDLSASVHDVQNYQLVVSTPLGQTVMKSSSLQHKNKFDLTQLAAGIYFIEVSGPAGKGIFKVVKR